jgi:hypothetical protein
MPKTEEIVQQLEARRAFKGVLENQVAVLQQLLDGARLVLENVKQEERDLESNLAAARRNGTHLVSTKGGTS